MYNIYKINYKNINVYSQYGGNNITTYVPDYPEKIEHTRSADWPPIVGTTINVKIPNDDKTFSGVVSENVWNDTASIIKLDNSNYVEVSLKEDIKWNNGIGYFLFLPDYFWSSSDKNILDITGDTANQKSTNNDDIITKSTNNNDIITKRTNNDNNIITKRLNINTNRDNNTDLNVKEYNISKNDSTILSTKLPNTIPDNHETVTNNKIYKPLLPDSKKNYFSDNKVDIIISNTKMNFTSLSNDKIELLSKKLKAFENINDKDIKLIVNRNIAINNLITDPSDEINEGDKLIKWINNVLKKKVFTDLTIKLHEGYVYITREGIKVIDVITKDLVPELNHFDWQEGKPINYDTLKYVIFQNIFQKNIQDNISQKREAEDILSQEYIIALQPSPLYQLWTLKKLIMTWYGDPIVEPHIRKIKVLINQYRADPTQEYNKKNGILGSILVYPKYGVESSKIVLSKLDYYFSLYVDENTNPRYQDIQWNGSNPSYFIKKNSLIYYTNGSIDLKNYIKLSLQSNNILSNDILTNDYTEILESKKIMGV